MTAPYPVGPVLDSIASSGTTAVFTKTSPFAAAMAAGDVLVAGQRAQGTVATAITLPSGWVLGSAANGAADRAQGIAYHVVTDPAAEPATWTFGGWSAGREAGQMIILRGVDLANIIGGRPPYSTADLAAYAVGAAPFTAIAMWGDERTTGRSHHPSTTPAGYTAFGNLQSTGDESTTGSRTAMWWGYHSVEDGGSPAVAAAALVWPDGVSANRSVGVAFQGVGTPVDPPKGFDSVGQMLATPGNTWAHRGGSADWPEMSEYAYQQAAIRGYPVLEFQAQRSSDGWWFGLHDNNFDRTSQVSGSPAPSTLTKAQILATYQNTLNSNGTPRPYWGLIDFLDKWTPTHVVVIDPKNQLGHTAEFIALLKAHGGNRKIVVKYSGVGAGSAALADAAKADGFQTWGYFYEPDIADGDVALWQSHWSMLGMEWGASQASWDVMKSYNKPLVAHIAATQVGYDTGIARGAQMVQCSGVAAIPAVGRSDSPEQPWDAAWVGGKIAHQMWLNGELIWP